MCGITSQTIRRKLLGVADLTLKKAVDIAVSMELTEKEISEISSEPKTVQKADLHDPCFLCGHKDSECHTCKQKGQISPQCPQPEVNPSNRKLSRERKRKKHSRIKLLGTESGSESEASSF